MSWAIKVVVMHLVHIPEAAEEVELRRLGAEELSIVVATEVKVTRVL